MSPSLALPLPELLSRAVGRSLRLAVTLPHELSRLPRLRGDRGLAHAHDPHPTRPDGDDDVSPHAARPADDLTTTELLITTSRSLEEDTDTGRAERARHLARVYLARRQRRLRDELEDLR